MKYIRFLETVKAISSREGVFPKTEHAHMGLLEYSLEWVAVRAYSRVLLTTDPNREILKVAEYGENQFVARPFLPVDDETHLDIDEGLVFAVIQIYVSLLSIEKYVHHEKKASEIIEKYNNAAMTFLG